MAEQKTFSLEEAIQAQKALRNLAGMGPETFPVEAFVGMISDEIETLRKMGRSDDEIAGVIRANSGIDISAAEIARNYAAREKRGRPDEA